MRRIVVGVDESEGAAEALRWAVAESAFDGAEVTALLAWDWLDQHHRRGEGFDPSYSKTEATEALAANVAAALGPDATHVATRVVCDLAAPALLAAMDQADLLVLGARGAGGFTGLLLGSVAHQCLHHAKRPVAIIRAGVGLTADRKRIVAAVDGSDASLRALRWAVDETRLRSDALEVVNAWGVPAVGYTPYGHLVIDEHRFEEESRRILDDALAAVETGGVQVNSISVRRGTVPAILDTAVDAALLVVGSHGHGAFKRALFGSVTTQLSHHAPCPLVVVPPANRDDA